ncbi:hypothetical protein CVU75_03165 [Candidatus Dependentiae bacterium HGW-Dependentiae-1]|nr:MAG: hypothetical protein CVU75_03165 [Candidatus Dependentiae bacterium HGW-Dependentiae-1]
MLATKKHLSLLLSATLLLPACSWFSSDVHKIDTITQAEQELSRATPNTLIIFDIDQTLANPTEQLFNLLYLSVSDFALADHPFIKKLIANNPDLKAARKGFNHQPTFVGALFTKSSFIPVEQKTITLAKDAQARGAKVIALSSVNTGELGSIPSMQQWRVKNLHQIGLDFSASFPQQELTFTQLPPEYGTPPAFYQGVLCASRNPKGKVLVAFLEKINWKPANILFFDDSKEQCESVIHEMKKLGIPTISYWYRAAYLAKIKLDQKLIQQQMDHWATHKEFLSTQEFSEKTKTD